MLEAFRRLPMVARVGFRKTLVSTGPRFLAMSSQAFVPRISLNKDLVEIKWKDGDCNHYPSVWLRDNCQCEACFDQSSKQRKIIMRHFDHKIRPSEAVLDEGTEQVTVTWPDGHVGVFEKKWLKDRNFTGSLRQDRVNMALSPPPKLWGNNDAHSHYDLKRHNFGRICSDDKALYDWLKDLQDYGLVLVDEMPRKREALKQLVTRGGCTRSTHYGENFHVIVKAGANNLAYTGLTLGLHVDLPYYGYNPGSQFLQCIEQESVEGGENEFADAFYVANLMKEKFHDEWKILSTAPVEFNDEGRDEFGEFFKVKCAPIFSHNKDGRLTCVSYSNQVRDSYFTAMKPDDVTKFYEALCHLDQLLYENLILYKMKAGECVVFDNLRVLHGRRGFSVGDKGRREVQGAYLDWDEIRSRINVLSFKYGDSTGEGPSS